MMAGLNTLFLTDRTDRKQYNSQSLINTAEHSLEANPGLGNPGHGDKGDAV